MKNLKIYILLAGVLFTTFSCDKDDLDSQSIFNTDTPTKNEFDQWIRKNLTNPYNITIDYLYNDHETDLDANVIPTTIPQSIGLAKLVKHVWMDPYTEVGGADFLKYNCFRQFVFVGSGEYDGQGTMKLGQAEGGVKVTLFRVNELNFDRLYINNEDYYRQHSTLPLDLNYWYFHTMHHEFCHILTQKKEYTPEFRLVSAGTYKGPGWVNVRDTTAAKDGFVTGYATGEYNEDFAETYAVYVTSSDKIWNQILEKATKYLVDDNGMPVYVLDKKGNPVVKSKEYQRDTNGLLVPETDANGNIVYATDKKGNPIYFKNSKGEKIPMYNEQTKGGIYYDVKGDSIEAYFVYSNKPYPITASATSFTPTVETINGDTIYTKDGKTIQKYYRVPLFKYNYEYVQKVDETSKKKILTKLNYIRAYFMDKWNIDIDKLREKIQERTTMESLNSLDLKSLKD